jgi:tetratricopeptide (TPR) repeat protein
VEDPYDEARLEYQGGRLKRCREMLVELLAKQPQHVPGLILWGIVAGQRRELDEALQAFERVLAIQPENPRAHFNKANILLLLGDWEEGWRHYEWRWQLAEFAAWRSASPSRPLWSGQPLQGKTVLLRCEQGLGDTLQFCRYVKPLAERGAHVILEAQRPLVSLLADLDGLGQIVTQGAQMPECDYYCPLLSLPLACKTTVANVPQAQPYLTADAAKVAEWRARLGERAVPRVGLVWRGTAARANDDRRSLPLQTLLTQLPVGPEYVSLQKQLDSAESQLLRNNPQIGNFAPLLHDFSDTAALCQCLDIVISIDTSVAHLSAALGKPTIILLQFSPAWRWLLDRDDSPWYRSARLVRQRQADEWVDVCARAAQLLRNGL